MMHQTVFLNGAYLNRDQATPSLWDRGLLFGESLYEVIPTIDGKLFLAKAHIQRLLDGLKQFDIPSPYQMEQWLEYMQGLADQAPGECLLYCQITRGTGATRTHLWPENIKPNVWMFTQPYKPIQQASDIQTITAITATDPRWSMCHVKTTNLMANTYLVNQAHRSGCDEALLLREGLLTEGTSSNVFVIKNGRLYTPKANQHILPGITRALLLELAAKHGMPYHVGPCSETLLKTADEIFITSSSRMMSPVVKLDQQPVGLGNVGPMTRQLAQHCFDYIDTWRSEHAKN